MGRRIEIPLPVGQEDRGLVVILQASEDFNPDIAAQRLCKFFGYMPGSVQNRFFRNLDFQNLYRDKPRYYRCGELQLL